MAPVVYVFAVPIPLLPFVLSLVLVPFIGAFAKFILRLRSQKHGQVTKELKDGLDIVYEGSKAEIDIVAVHGFGANPNYAWTADVGSKVRFRWLERLLPKEVPNSRIMTFSFQSNWLLDAPKTRTTLCATALLDALHNKRQETNSTERPIIFMGHSFGGNLIQQAIVNAHLHEGREDITMATAGVIFFGTPHRGSKDASWGRIIADLGSYSGFNSYDGIIKDLEEESTHQIDLLHSFSVWLRRMSVETVCFFELKETDYGRKIGLTGIRRKIVVTETSACIDGYRKVSLDVDHLHLNQFKGSDDASYKKFQPEIKRMVDGALAKILRRMNPRQIVYNDEQIRSTANSTEKLRCLQALVVVESDVILENLRRTKGGRVEGTCEWVLINSQFTEWLNADKSQLLRLTGGPGIGKTMIATFLVDELKERAQYSESDLFAFFLCDNKDERQRTATAVLRSLLVQLLRQRPSFFSYMQPEYEKYGEDKFKGVFCIDFGALWMVFEAILRDPAERWITIIIDALDECEEESKSNLVKVLHDFFDPNSRNNKAKSNKGKSNTLVQTVKIIIAHRPEPSIEKGFLHGTQPLKVDTGLINRDLSKFIREKTEKLRDDFDLDSEKADQIRDVLERKAEGTFLWVSLVLGEMDERDTQGNITGLLDKLPSGLPETYERILRKIKLAHGNDASFILRIIFIARRPLKVDELAIICLLGLGTYDKTTLPTIQDLNEWRHEYRCCGAFLKVDEENETIHLVHQSAKDFLEDLSRHDDLAGFYPEASASNFDMLHVCWKYMSIEKAEKTALSEEVAHEAEIAHEAEMISDEEMILVGKRHDFQGRRWFDYADREWRDHALTAYPGWVDRPGMEKSILDKLPKFRDHWLLLAAEAGQDAAVEQLLDRGASIESVTGRARDSPIWVAAIHGHEKVVEVLLNKGAEVDLKDRGAKVDLADASNETPLICAAKYRDEAIAKLLINSGANVNAEPKSGLTPLILAAQTGVEAFSKLLLGSGADVNYKAGSGLTALSMATWHAHGDFARLLVDHGAGASPEEQEWLDSLSSAAGRT
ncbi:hypothetical protein VE04_08013 [Pseudogymnoascus sp. 24MN13]|nr:hypothetical protein VE04_08013 [Pseudogymnoascus sp. 24MN13]